MRAFGVIPADRLPSFPPPSCPSSSSFLPYTLFLGWPKRGAAGWPRRRLRGRGGEHHARRMRLPAREGRPGLSRAPARTPQSLKSHRRRGWGSARRSERSSVMQVFAVVAAADAEREEGSKGPPLMRPSVPLWGLGLTWRWPWPRSSRTAAALLRLATADFGWRRPCCSRSLLWTFGPSRGGPSAPWCCPSS